MDNNEEITRIINARRAYRTIDILFPLQQVGLLGAP